MNHQHLPREELFDYDEVRAELEGLDAVSSAAEVHGELTGMLAVGVEIDARSWVELLLDEADDVDDVDELSMAFMQQLFGLVADDIARIEFDFPLLLPDDEQPLAERLQALSEWCRGFISGVGFREFEEQIPDEINNTLQDIAKLATVDIDVDESEEDEADYTELVEFLRMAALIVYTELNVRFQEATNTQPPAEDPPSRLH